MTEIEPTEETEPQTVTKPIDFTEQPIASSTSPSSSPGNVSSNGTEISTRNLLLADQMYYNNNTSILWQRSDMYECIVVLL